MLEKCLETNSLNLHNEIHFCFICFWPGRADDLNENKRRQKARFR